MYNNCAAGDCFGNGNGNGGGGGGTPSPTPTPNPYESPCPIGLDMQQMVNDYDARAQQARKDYDIKNGGRGAAKRPTVSIADVSQYDTIQFYASHSGKTSYTTTVRTPEEDGRQRYFTDPPLDPRGIPYSYYDAERKMMEYLADYNHHSNSTFGDIKLYADRETCQHCQPLAGEFRQMFPNTNLLWFDKTGKCY